jgi:biopolymer transport protein ExbB
MDDIYQIINYYAKSGGIINVLLFLVCFMVVYLGVGKAIQIRRNDKASMKWLNQTQKSIDFKHPVDTVYGAMMLAGLNVSGANKIFSREHYRNVFREILLKYIPDFERGFDTIAACVATAPLLGLLGTVAGMMKTFRIIMEFGIGNPGLLSEGISMALVTTQSGLIVAFPCLLFHNYLHNRKEELIKRIIADGERVILQINEEEKDD